VKSIRGDEPNGVVMHICMETTQGNSMYSYLYLKLPKSHVFLFYLFSFFFFKIREQESGTCTEGTVTSGRGEITGKGGRWMNTVQKCIHMYVNAKKIPVETVPGIG
jgi:hypothetical protein